MSDAAAPPAAPPTPQTVLLASARGWCAGVERAVDAVRETLALHGPPVYVRKQIVHNLHVVRELEEQGAIFVDTMSEVPEGSTVVLSAHGVAPTVHAKGRERKLDVVDATCPLVTKVHKQAIRYARDGYMMVMIGHEGHEETVGTMGEAPDHIVLVQTAEDVEALDIGQPEKLAYITQTTLSVDETTSIIAALKAKYPQIVAPAKGDICYATTNRQLAVKELAQQVDLVLVLGSLNSSNSVRLAEVAREAGTAAHRIDDETEIRDEWLVGVDTVGITSGASAPETLVERVCEFFRQRGTTDIRKVAQADEGVHFMLPTELRLAMAERSGGKP
jgi:4-hydroxy-3-methylbut-2-enyl diphosphate reductase